MVMIKGGLFPASRESSLAVDQGCTDLPLLVLVVQLLHSAALCTVDVP